MTAQSEELVRYLLLEHFDAVNTSDTGQEGVETVSRRVARAR
jgi:hypothetical protein